MFWLDNLPQPKVTKPKKMSVREYKEKYYVKNINKYIERNRNASKERSIQLMEDRASEEELNHMIEKLSTDEIIYKMIYILNNQ